MNIRKLNQYSEEQIIGLKNEDNKVRLIIDEQPDLMKLQLLKDAIINETTEVTLVIWSNDNNLIELSKFECISNNVVGFESYNYGEMLKSIKGISIFKNLRNVVINQLYDNKLCIDELASLENLEELNMRPIPITKYQYPGLNKLSVLKRLKVVGLDSNMLSCLPNLEELICYRFKDGSNLEYVMPNLKEIIIIDSPKIKELDFLFGLKRLNYIRLEGLSQIEELPDLSSISTLESLRLVNMKRLKKFPIHHMGLKELAVKLPMDALDDVRPENLPKLGKIIVDLGSIKRSEMVLSRFRGFCEATMTAL